MNYQTFFNKLQRLVESNHNDQLASGRLQWSGESNHYYQADVYVLGTAPGCICIGTPPTICTWPGAAGCGKLAFSVPRPRDAEAILSDYLTDHLARGAVRALDVDSMDEPGMISV